MAEHSEMAWNVQTGFWGQGGRGRVSTEIIIFTVFLSGRDKREKISLLDVLEWWKGSVRKMLGQVHQIFKLVVCLIWSNLGVVSEERVVARVSTHLYAYADNADEYAQSAVLYVQISGLYAV